jgi:cytochrome c551/c552
MGIVEPTTLMGLALTAATLIATKFGEGSASELGKKAVGQLWEMVAARFKGDRRAELALQKLEQDPGTASIEKLAGYLADEMELHGEFQEMLAAIVSEWQRAEPEQQMLVGLEVEGHLKAGNLRQSGAGSQVMLKDVQAGSIELGDLTQE